MTARYSKRISDQLVIKLFQGTLVCITLVVLNEGDEGHLNTPYRKGDTRANKNNHHLQNDKIFLMLHHL